MTSAPPDTISVRTADNVSLGYAAAGVGSRMVAQIIDSALAAVLMLIALLGALSLGHFASSAQGQQWAIGAAIALALFVYVAYFFMSELVTGGRTLGKAAMGLRVLRLDGASPDLAAIAVRNLVRIVDVVFLGAGLIVMFFHPLSRRLGDLAAGTVVVRERTSAPRAAPAPPPLLLRTPDAGPAIDGIERLGGAEHNALRVFLTREGLQPQLRQRLAADLAARLCDRLDLPAHAPERSWPAELLLERMYLQLEARPR